MIKSDLIKIKNTGNINDFLIENSLKDKNIVRWAVVAVDEEFITISLSYEI